MTVGQRRPRSRRCTAARSRHALHRPLHEHNPLLIPATGADQEWRASPGGARRPGCAPPSPAPVRGFSKPTPDSKPSGTLDARRPRLRRIPLRRGGRRASGCSARKVWGRAAGQAAGMHQTPLSQVPRARAGAPSRRRAPATEVHGRAEELYRQQAPDASAAGRTSIKWPRAIATGSRPRRVSASTRVPHPPITRCTTGGTNNHRTRSQTKAAVSCPGS